MAAIGKIGSIFRKITASNAKKIGKEANSVMQGNTVNTLYDLKSAVGKLIYKGGTLGEFEDAFRLDNIGVINTKGKSALADLEGYCIKMINPGATSFLHDTNRHVMFNFGPNNKLLKMSVIEPRTQKEIFSRNYDSLTGNPIIS